MVLILMSLRIRGYLPRLLIIDEECGNLKVVVDGGDLTGNLT